MSAFGSLHDVFHSTAFTVARNVTLFFVVLFWLGFAYWTHRDARRRDRRSLARRDCDPARPRSVRRPARLSPVPAAGDPRGGAEPGCRAAALETRISRQQPQCPVCRSPVEAGVPDLPRLHDAPQGAVLPLRGAARAALAGVPLLQDARGEGPAGGSRRSRRRSHCGGGVQRQREAAGKAAA